MIRSKFFKLILVNFLILSIESLKETILLSNDQTSNFMREGDTTGLCARQLNLNPQERNCRYGRCEQIRNGSDFVCHCDNFITGKKCDRLVIDTSDGCASNPCWGESLCITIEETNTYKCLCPQSRTGMFCQIKINRGENSENKTDFEIRKEIIFTTSLTIPQYTTHSLIRSHTKILNYSLEGIKKNSSINNESLEIENPSNQKADLASSSSLKASNTTCNSENCQFGKCLSNDTCDCTKPAFGKYCDQIDECLVLSCKNGKCEKNKGCICNKGFQGVLCDIPVIKMNFFGGYFQKGIKKELNMPENISIKQNFSTLPINLKNNASNNNKIPIYISSCENGGLLIDNMCLCLNQFTGRRCEIPPTFSDSILNTKAPELESIEPITPKVNAKKIPSKIDKIETKDELIPIITLSRFNTKTKNITSQRTIYWPWFECFPGESNVYSKNSKSGKVEKKKISQLEIGDQILVVKDYYRSANFSINQFKFSPIVSFLHKIDNIDARFFRLHFKNSLNMTAYITLTPRHLIYVKRKDRKEFEFIAAFEVSVGDILKKYDFIEGYHQNVSVIKIEKMLIKKSGIYAPLTESGTLIVDNILASCYSMVKYHGTAQLFFNFLNMLNYFVDLTSDVYVYYSKILYEVLNFLHLNKTFMNERLQV